MVGNGILLPAFQKIRMVDPVFAGKLHAADTHSVFLSDGDLGFHDTEKVTLFRLEISVGTDDNGIYEYVIEFDIYYERK